MKFRKKPVVIEAFQFTKETLKQAAEFCAGDIDAPVNEFEPNHSIIIHTREGNMRASEGDWIIRGVQGEYYPCKPDIFAATYEPAE
jgi:hypothetical protein